MRVVRGELADLAAVDVREPDRHRAAIGGRELAPVGGERQAADRLGELDLARRCVGPREVPHLYVLERGGGEPLAVGRQRGRERALDMAGQLPADARCEVPHARGAVGARRHEAGPVLRHRDRVDALGVTRQPPGRPVVDVPHPDVALEPRGHERVPVGREAELGHGVAGDERAARAGRELGDPHLAPERRRHHALAVRRQRDPGDVAVADLHMRRRAGRTRGHRDQPCAIPVREARAERLEERERRGRVAIEQRVRLQQRQVVGSPRRLGLLRDRVGALDLGVAACILGDTPRLVGAIALVDDALDAGDREHREGHDRDRDHVQRRAVPAHPPAHELPRRVAVRPDELPGLELLEIVGELARGRVALAGRRRHRARDDREEVRRQIRLERRQRRRVLGEHAREHRLPRDAGLALAGERRPSGEHVVEDRAERVDIRALVDTFAARLLARHVRRRAHHLADRGLVRAGRGAIRRERLLVACREVFREAPIDDDGLAELADEDVRRLEVAVDHALGVRVRDRVGHGDHLRQQRQPLREIRRRLDHLVEPLTRHLLHRVERQPVAARAGAIDRHDRRMLQARGHLRLALEAPAEIVAIDRDQLERDRATEPRARRGEHRAHAAGADLPVDRVPLGLVDERVALCDLDTWPHRRHQLDHRRSQRARRVSITLGPTHPGGISRPPGCSRSSYPSGL